jgi:hypothetical protein
VAPPSGVTGADIMSLEHWMLAALVMCGLGVNVWVGWMAYHVHQAQVVVVLQNRNIKDVVNELHRLLLARGDAR